MKHHRGQLCGAGAAVLFTALIGCGVERADRASVVSPAVEEESEVQSCQQLIDAGWTAPPIDPSFLVDPDTGITEVSFGEGETLRLDVVGDPACMSLPDIGGILSQLTGEYEQIRFEECTDAVEDIITGVAPTKAGQPANMEALRQHVLQWCPPDFSEQLRKAGF